MDIATCLKSKARDLPTGMASLYNVARWLPFCIEVFVAINYGQVYKILLMVLTGLGTWLFWTRYGSASWRSRAQGVCLTETRSNYGIVFGDGLTGLRKFVITVCMVVTMFGVVCKGSFNVALMAAFVAVACHNSKRTMVSITGALSQNWTLLFRGLQARPMTDSLVKGTEEADVGTNRAAVLHSLGLSRKGF